MSVEGSGGDGGSTLSQEKISKIRRDLEVVRNNMSVFSDILTEINPAASRSENSPDLELLHELYKTCKEMQSRVGQLLCSPTTDELTVDMLQINDDLNDLFDRYERKTGTQDPDRDQDRPLIDLADNEPAIVTGVKGLAISDPKTQASANKKPGPDDDFDQLAQSRKSPQNKPDASPSQPLTEEEIIDSHRETDFQEMEAWLRANPGADTSLMSIPAQMDNYFKSKNQPGGT